MTWLRIDDKRAMHRKFRRQGFAARGLDEAAMCWCAHEETDGYVSVEALEDLAYHHGVSKSAALKLVDALLSCGRWTKVGTGGWSVEGYLDFNPSHADLEAQRSARREAGRRGGIRSGQVRSASTDDEASA